MSASAVFAATFFYSEESKKEPVCGSNSAVNAFLHCLALDPRCKESDRLVDEGDAQEMLDAFITEKGEDPRVRWVERDGEEGVDFTNLKAFMTQVGEEYTAYTDPTRITPGEWRQAAQRACLLLYVR